MIRTPVSSVEFRVITHDTEPASLRGVTAWSVHIPKMRFSLKEQKQTEGKLRGISDDKPREERRMRGNASRGKKGGSGSWTHTECHWAGRNMQVKSLCAVGCYTTLTQAFTRARDLEDGWDRGRRKEAWRIGEKDTPGTIPYKPLPCFVKSNRSNFKWVKFPSKMPFQFHLFNARHKVTTHKGILQSGRVSEVTHDHKDTASFL